MKIRSKHYELLTLLALLWAATVTVLRALRWPNDWAEAHWLISYNFGFLKRGLVGTLFSPFANENSELAIWIVSASLFVLFCIVLFWICMHVIRRNKYDNISLLVVLLFLTSPYMVMSGHLNGYFDNIIIIISVLVCVLIKQNKIILSSLVVSIGLLVHETILMVGFPSIVFFALLQHIRQTKSSSTVKLLLSFLSQYKFLFLIPVFMFICIFLNQTFYLDSAVLENQLISHLSQFEFVENERNILVPKAFTSSFHEYVGNQDLPFIQRITVPIYIFHIGLPLFVLLSFGWRKLQAIDSKWVYFLILVAITLLPLTLHIVAWDTSRIWTYPLIVALLGVWAITETIPAKQTQKETPVWLFVAAIVVIVSQLFISTPLMDGAIERFSNVNRILLYAPSLIVIAAFMTNSYRSSSN
ncbi:MAG: hypothetical protein GY752_04890 [bacterium]|nr:hypothetical protein [bacterium]MCP4800249.1 hypothetical protein [bacterium]